MKKLISWILCIVIIAGTAMCPLYSYAQNSTQDKLNSANADYDEIDSNLNESQNQLNELNENKNELEASLDELNDKLYEISNVLAELEKCISEKREQIDNTWGRIEMLATQVDEIEAEADAQYELTKAQIKYMYEQGDNLYISLLLSSDSFADYINKNSYIELMSEYQREQLKKNRQLQQELREKQTEYENELVVLEEEKAELDEYEERVVEQQERIEKLVDETSAKIDAYSDQIESTQSKIEKYEEQLKKKNEDINTLKSTLEEEKRTAEIASDAKWTDISEVNTVSSDRKLLANIIWCEAGDEPYVGQVAVGSVVMNRVMSEAFPNTIVGVIYQKGQFTPASSGKLALALAKDRATQECYQAADAALSGVTNVGNCLYFRTPTNKVTPKYVIGGHIFY